MVEVALAADFALIIVAATVVGLIARRFGQPTIVAYILTGVLLGPVLLNVVTVDGLVEHMAELGLGFLLFLLGLKMRFEDIRDILAPITNIAIGQTVLQTALAFAVALALGFQTVEVLVIALATVFGATPIIVKILTDKDEITSLPGKIDVGVLIIQDIYLVIILALFSADELGDPSQVATTLAVTFVMMAFILVFSLGSSRYLLPEIFRRIADNKDVFLIVAIGWAFLFIAVAEGFNLSVEVGAFLAGISLAQLPYSKELEDRITPITDFFILIFFASIGLRIDGAEVLFAFWQEALIASAVLMIGNFWIMFYLIDREGFAVETSFLGSINMVQVSEFSLVVGALALNQELINEEILGYLTLMALVTMTASTYLITYNHSIFDRVHPLFSIFEGDHPRETTPTEHTDHAVAIGYDEMTKAVLPLLEDRFGQVVVIDRKTDQIGELKAIDQYDAVFGDFRHSEVRKASGLSRASFVFSSTVEGDINEALLDEVADDATVFVEATTIDDAYRLYDRGAAYVVMSTFLAAEELSKYVAQYFDDRESFSKAVQSEIDRIRREGNRRAVDELGVDLSIDPRDLGDLDE